jgi:hypothetical protein
MENNVYDTRTHIILQSRKQKGKREFGVAFIVDKSDEEEHIDIYTCQSKDLCTTIENEVF